jgi:RNA polymerase sigma factor (sigma-70 family)
MDQIASDTQREGWGAWMAAAQAGDQVAYRQLLQAILPYVRAYSHRHLSRRDSAEDLIQDIFLTVHRIRHTYDPSRPFLPWLSVIAKRRLIDHLRRRRIFPEAIEDLGMDLETFCDPAANRDLDQFAHADTLRRAMAELPDSQRRVIELLKIEEKTLKEAAVITGMSIAALKTTTHRAIKALRAHLLKLEG